MTKVQAPLPRVFNHRSARMCDPSVTLYHWKRHQSLFHSKENAQFTALGIQSMYVSSLIGVVVKGLTVCLFLHQSNIVRSQNPNLGRARQIAMTISRSCGFEHSFCVTRGMTERSLIYISDPLILLIPPLQPTTTTTPMAQLTTPSTETITETFNLIVQKGKHIPPLYPSDH